LTTATYVELLEHIFHQLFKYSRRLSAGKLFSYIQWVSQG